jgi:ribose transport system substrate-binding protein
MRQLLFLLALALPACQQPEPGWRVVVIPKGLTHEFWQSIHRGALRAAADLTAQGHPTHIIWDGPLREQDALAQIQIVDRRVCTGVNGIVLAPQHSQTMTAPVKRAGEENIPVVIIDSGLEEPDLFVKYVATDNYHGGWLAGEHLVKVLAEQGKTEPKLILLRYQVGSESTDRREQGFLDYFDPSNTKYERKVPPPKKVEWLSTNKYAGATRDSASREAGPLIQQYGSQVDGIFAPNESSASGVLDVLRSQGLNKKIVLMGFDSSEPLLSAVEEGDVAGLILQDPYRMGYLGTWVLVQYLEGYDVSVGGKDLSTGEYVITRENIHDPATVGLFNPAAQERRTITPPTFPKRKAAP